MTLIAQQLLRNSDFSCVLTNLFRDCPTLPSVATKLLNDEWQVRSISPQAPTALYLLSTQSNLEYDNLRPLSQVLIERFCRRGDLQLQPSSDTLLESPNDVSGLAVDLGQVQRLINDCGPLLLDHYRQALVDYWNQADDTGQTIWQRYSSYLRQQLSASIAEVQPGTVAPAMLELAAQIAAYPSAEARRQVPGTRNPRLSLLSLDLTQGLRLNQLTGALLIAPHDETVDGPLALYTLTGHLQIFMSYAALLQKLGRLCPELADKQPQLQLQPLTGHAFDALAMQVLEQQLNIVDRITERYAAGQDAQRLCLELSHLTALFDLCPQVERDNIMQAVKLLPDWLHRANEHALIDYAHMLLDIAQQHANAQGATWLESIDDAQLFTYRKINEYIAIEHPEHDLEPWDVQLINHQTIASALPTGHVAGAVKAVPYTLAQLAIANWGLILPGRVELRHTRGALLPDWLTEAFLRKMVTELNIGKAYPQMLQDTLLDNPTERRRRQRLLADQLRSQIPAAAAELELRRQLSPLARQAVCDVFAATPATSQRWVIRPLGLIREPGAAADHPLNTWLIEAADHLPNDLCVLYRPLHAHSLLEFADRARMLRTLAAPGALHDDMLQRLPQDVRSIYAHEGFNEPNLPGQMELTLLGVPYQKPEPVTLAREAALTQLGQSIYLGCVEETIADFRAHSATSEQARWAQWKALGWLLLNSALPLISGPVGTIVWLTQIAVALKQFLQTGASHDNGQHRIALVNLLVNVGLAVFAHAAPRMQLQRPETLPGEAPALLPGNVDMFTTESVVPKRLEQGWAANEAQLHSTQREALAALRSSRTIEALGMPIVSGDLRGLYQTDEDYWTILDNNVYRVVFDDEMQQPRIVSDTQPPAPGPWLRQGTSSRWQLDLRLRLRGGMQGGPRRRAVIAQKAQRRETLTGLIREGRQQVMNKTTELLRLETLTRATDNKAILELSLSKIDSIEAFWDEFIGNLEEHAELTNVHPDNGTKAQWEFQRYFAKLTRSNLLAKIVLQRLAPAPRDAFATAEERTAYIQALNETTPLLERLVSNAEGIRQPLMTLERLAGNRGPAYDRYINAKTLLNVPIEQKMLATRMLRLENNWRKFITLPNLAERASYLLDRCWVNLKLAISQRMRLYETPQASEELSARLLHDIDSQFGFALRRLDNLKQAVASDPAALEVLEPIEVDMRSVANSVKQDLQDYPPSSSVAQLQRQTPGLIETASHGLLLGQPRAGDDTLFDIMDNNQQPFMTFHKQDREWVPIKKEAAEPAAITQPANLKRLFQAASAEQEKAENTLNFLESSAAQNFQPVEFEELIDMHRLPLAEQAATLATRLNLEESLLPATRERYQEQLDAIGALLQQLESKRVELRTQAILRQKPRQPGLQYLFEQGGVTIQSQGRRRLLSRVPGRAQDYMDEYVVIHDGAPLWYAHFHYTSLDSAKGDYVAGHLKTQEQRLLRGHSVVDPVTQKVEFVHRGPITHAAANRYFFTP
ncbi:hypothetical protein [Pseudomonas putida]